MRILLASSKNWFSLEKKLAAQHEVLLVNEANKLNVPFLEKFQPEIIFFVHWHWRVPPEIHDNYQCVVFHTAPLPYGRGGSPIQNLILDGHTEAPVNALKMTADIDDGPIYSSQLVSLEGSLNTILRRINVAINSLIEELLFNGLPIPSPQIGEPTYFSRRKKEQNLIPNNLELSGVYDRIRMLDDENYPRAYLVVGDYRIEFHSSQFTGKELIAKCKIEKC